MVFNAIFNNISVILWRSVLLVKETRVHWENHRSVTDKLDHILLYRVQDGAVFEFPTLVMIGTDCIGSCKSSYYSLSSKTRTCVSFSYSLHCTRVVHTGVFAKNIFLFSLQTYMYIYSSSIVDFILSLNVLYSVIPISSTKHFIILFYLYSTININQVGMRDYIFLIN
jgi:hypothetical protein